MYPIDPSKEEILQSALRYLRWQQLWPQNTNLFHSISYYIRLIMILTFSLMTFGGTMGHIYRTITNRSSLVIVDAIEDAIVLVVHVIVLYTVYALVVNREELEKLLEKLSDFRRFGRPPRLDAANEWANKFATFFFGYVISAPVGTCVMAMMERKECKQIFADLKKERICGFVEPVWVPFDIISTPNYQIYWLITTVSLILLLNSGAIVMSFIFGLNEICLSLIDHLNEEIMSIGEDPKRAPVKIGFCIDYHNELIDVCNIMNFCWGKLMLMHQMLVTILLSLIGIQFLIEPNPKCIMHAIGWLISLSIPCYAGQRLLDKSAEIPLVMYSSKWYNLANKDQKNFIFMILKANKLLALDRDGYGPMSMETVGSVVNNIYSLLTLLSRSMQNNIEHHNNNNNNLN